MSHACTGLFYDAVLYRDHPEQSFEKRTLQWTATMHIVQLVGGIMLFSLGEPS